MSPADDSVLTVLPETVAASGSWPAHLELDFARRGETTVLARRRHFGPLRVQKPLYPEGPETCHAIVLHPPAGIAGGDELTMDFTLDAGAHALLTTPGAGKWYRSAGAHASQTVSLHVGAGAVAEWLPQESIIFDGALARMQTGIHLAPDACFIGVETICFGRRASGESFRRGQLRLATDITRAGKLLWRERGIIDGGSPLLHSPIGLASRSVCSTMLGAGLAVTGEALALARAINPGEAGAQCGVTALPDLFVARYLGDSAEAARAWFMEVWTIVRPLFAGMPAHAPRIWAT